jgi:hypothetical protein
MTDLDDLGLDEKSMALIDAAADAAPKKEKSARIDRFSAARQELELGIMIQPVQIGSVANKSEAKVANRLYGYYQAMDLPPLKAYLLGGTNTYAKALRQYRDMLVKSLEGLLERAKSDPLTQEAINVVRANANREAEPEKLETVLMTDSPPCQHFHPTPQVVLDAFGFPEKTTEDQAHVHNGNCDHDADASDMPEQPDLLPAKEWEPTLYKNQALANAAALTIFGADAVAGTDYRLVNRGNQKRPRYEIVGDA